MAKNKSMTYFLFYMSEYIDIQFVERLHNTYLFYNKEYKFCMEYEFIGKKAFTDYEASLTQNEYYIETIDVSPTNVMFIFDIPDPLFSIVELFLSGKYSYLPKKEDLKDFLRVNFAITTNHKIIHIIDRTSELRTQLEEQLGVVLPTDLDLSSPPDINQEEFNYKIDE